MHTLKNIVTPELPAIPTPHPERDEEEARRRALNSFWYERLSQGEWPAEPRTPASISA